MGNCLLSLGGKGWGIDAWPLVAMVDGGSPTDECGLSSALVLSLYLLYPFVSLISHINDTHAPIA